MKVPFEELAEAGVNPREVFVVFEKAAETKWFPVLGPAGVEGRAISGRIEKRHHVLTIKAVLIRRTVSV